MVRILGIDPGSRITGYGIIESDGNHNVYVTSGCIRTEYADHPRRLKVIFDSLQQLLDEHQPHETAIEQVFLAHNVDSALKLGQARGAALTACMSRNQLVGEYSARSIKQAVVGNGGASKEQVQHMVKILLSLNESPQSDAADALAVALCHGHARRSQQQLRQAAELKP
jgi:crossover junction endodeoxyribonuclease RuvC